MRSNVRPLILGPALLLAGCGGPAVWYAIPEQRPSPAADVAPLPKAFLQMADENAPAQFVRDIRTQGGATWRWTGKEPALRLSTPGTHPWKFVADLGISDVTFQQTGPVTIRVTVNGRLLDVFHFDTPGSRHIEKAVPAGWLSATSDNILTLAIDKEWVSPDDGARLGFTLQSAGFIR
ncbi:MAG TPA: hypothetical protein VMZ52_09680 [Bryobacteraceae bacterium]|nr:hypothetical protein [Bryobacteraceae bacterium]